MITNREAAPELQLSAYRHEYRRTSTNRVSRHACYEFQVRKQGESGYVWSCWTPDFARPHSFQVLTLESGARYACYVRDGVHLFRLSAERDPRQMRRAYWESIRPEEDHPDALPVLDGFHELFGIRNLMGLGPQTLNVSVVELTDRSGELWLSVRGQAERPEYTFALRQQKWQLITKKE